MKPTFAEARHHLHTFMIREKKDSLVSGKHPTEMSREELSEELLWVWAVYEAAAVLDDMNLRELANSLLTGRKPITPAHVARTLRDWGENFERLEDALEDVFSVAHSGSRL